MAGNCGDTINRRRYRCHFNSVKPLESLTNSVNLIKLSNISAVWPLCNLGVTVFVSYKRWWFLGYKFFFYFFLMQLKEINLIFFIIIGE